MTTFTHMILQASRVPQWRCRKRPTRGVHQRQPSPLRQGVRLPRQLPKADRRRRRLQLSHRGWRDCKRGHRHRRQPQQLQPHGFQSGAHLSMIMTKVNADWFSLGWATARSSGEQGEARSVLRHGSYEGWKHRSRQQGLQALYLPIRQGDC